MPLKEDIQQLVDEPREDLAYEYKDWLDLKSNEHKATLAKAAIALANHGGGFIVLGFAEQGQALESQPRPEAIPEITQDAINEAIRRYVEPEFHCEMHKCICTVTGVEHPVVIVPGTLTVPVMSKRESQGVIAPNRCYIRKPGPRSEEPLKSEEWRTLINRCVRANRDDMLEAIRSIITGSVETQPPTPNAVDELRDYCTAAHDRWKELVSNEPDDSASRFPHGYYEMGFALVGAKPANSLAELQDRLSVARRIKLSGWTPFLELIKPEMRPYPHEDFIEAWVGRPVQDDWLDKGPSHCDFWRASCDGKLYTIRGYFEDSSRNHFNLVHVFEDNPGNHFNPGCVFYTPLPIQRIGEGLLFASRFAETFEGVDQIAIRCRFTGLNGRCLTNVYHGQFMPSGYYSRTDEVILTEQVTQQQVQDNLAEIIHPLLLRLYERFDFFSLPFNLVSQVLQELRNNRI